MDQNRKQIKARKWNQEARWDQRNRVHQSIVAFIWKLDTKENIKREQNLCTKKAVNFLHKEAVLSIR